jgi:hypothetical protein
MITQAALAVFRGIAAASGLLSTAIFPRLHRAAGLTAAGAAGFAWLNACLIAGTAPTVAAAILGNPLSSWSAAAAAPVGDHAAGGPAAAPGGAATAGGAAAGGDKFGLASSPLLALLMSGLALSRLGIWLADLAVSQMQQEFVADDEIGGFGGSYLVLKVRGACGCQKAFHSRVWDKGSRAVGRWHAWLDRQARVAQLVRKQVTPISVDLASWPLLLYSVAFNRQTAILQAP